MLVPREHLANALSLNTTMLQLASVCGPAVGGILIAAPGLGWAYVINALSFLVVLGAVLRMRDIPGRDPSLPARTDGVSRRAAVEGVRFVFRSPLIRSAMLLDFFATFFSSATALLPIFAQDILHVGATGYGWLYAAPAFGALVMSAILVTTIDGMKRRGEILLWAVGVYGIATVVFGFSRTFWVSFACLAASGAADTISVVIRNVIRHLETPDALRGRMVGVSMVFFMGGPQLGEMEAGLVAQWLGAPFSVVSGGIGCLIATAFVAAYTPVLRRYGLAASAPAMLSPR
jgi:MFS family permease